MTDRTHLSTTSTSLRIVEHVAAEGEVTLRELTEETGLAKSTVHKHLKTLRANEFLVKSGEQYSLSLRHLALGRTAVDSRESYTLIEQRVRELGSTTDAEVDFTVEEHGRLIMVYETVGATNESTFGVGAEFELYNTAGGKAILAAYPDSRVEAILDDRAPDAWDDSDRDAFEAELERVRDQGYAFNDEETVVGYHSVGSTIDAPDGSVLGAITIGGPSYRIDRSRLREDLADKVREVTHELSELLATENPRS